VYNGKHLYELANWFQTGNVSNRCPMSCEIRTHMTESELTQRGRARARRPRSAVTSGRQLFIGGDPNSAWSRRFHDLIVGHIADLGGADLLSEAQSSLIRRCAALEVELERLDAALSRGEAVSLDEYGRAASHLRRIFETLGIKREQRDVTPTLEQYIATKAAEKAAERASVTEAPNPDAAEKHSRAS
jgi:hypothetical protein